MGGVDGERLRPYLKLCAARLRTAGQPDAGREAGPKGQAFLRVYWLVYAGRCYVSIGDRATGTAAFDDAAALGERLAADPQEPSAQEAARMARVIRDRKDTWLASD
jgi:hypothetical protein